MKVLNIDLHIHTVLSPCADLLMTPGNIIQRSLEKGIDIIAITDHNSAKNVKAALDISRDKALTVIPGMEVESAEEVHLLCLFPSLNKLLEWQEIVYYYLPDEDNNEEFFGCQLVVDSSDEFIKKEKKLLAAATKMSVKEIVEGVRCLEGVVIPSHVDRKYNSIITNLGFIPPDLNLSHLEISRNISPGKLYKKFPFLKGYSYIINSDSHYLKDIKPLTTLEIEDMVSGNILDSILRASPIFKDI